MPERTELSPRMLEILLLVGCERLSYKKAAARLGISVRTVQHHALEIRDRLGSARPPREAMIDHCWKNRKSLGYAA